tara:strand:+ start:106 stop:291 length:186 start_codon:yes stop_codon:yes gene_type:complete
MNNSIYNNHIFNDIDNKIYNLKEHILYLEQLNTKNPTTIMKKIKSYRDKLEKLYKFKYSNK